MERPDCLEELASRLSLVLVKHTVCLRKQPPHPQACKGDVAKAVAEALQAVVAKAVDEGCKVGVAKAVVEELLSVDGEHTEVVNPGGIARPPVFSSMACVVSPGGDDTQNFNLG
jgi:hypothetical protein